MKTIDSVPEYEKVIIYVENKINDGELIIGSKLPTERALAELLGISRNSAREAMSILSGMGIIDRVQGSGSYISPNASKSVGRLISLSLAMGRISEADIVEFRRTLERSICCSIVNQSFNDKQIKDFEEIINNFKNSATVEECLKWDKKFHGYLVEVTGNQIFKTIMGAVTNEYIAMMKKTIENADKDTLKLLIGIHEKLYRAIINKNQLEAVKKVEEHYKLVEELIC